MTKKRVVITGIGVVSSIGIGKDDFWKNLVAGKSGISEVTLFETSQYENHKGGEVKNFNPLDFIDKNNFDTNFEYYNQLKINDKIKNDYCEDNYINLIRIKYTDINNIKTILNPILRLKH